MIAAPDGTHWAAYRRVDEAKLYGEQRCSKIQYFKKEAEAVQFLEARDKYNLNQRDQGWRGPIPVLSIQSFSGKGFAGPWLTTKWASELQVDPRIETQFFDGQTERRYAWLRTRIADTIGGRSHEIECCLAADWRFPEISKEANKRLGHRVDGKVIRNFFAQLGLAAVDLQQTVREFHPKLTSEAIRSFWCSWDVVAHFEIFCSSRLCWRLENRMSVEKARQLLFAELAAYVNDPGSLVTAAEVATSRQPEFDPVVRAKEVAAAAKAKKDKLGLTFDQIAERASEHRKGAAVSTSTIERIFRGKHTVKGELVCAALKALDIDPGIFGYPLGEKEI